MCLDILISLNNKVLSTSIFYKPTASHAYLDYHSSHSLSTRNSIPYSQFLRLRRLCSDETDFDSQSRDMTIHFLNRRYPLHVVVNALARAKKVPRQSLLTRPPRVADPKPRAIFTFHPHNLPIKKILLDKWTLLKSDPDIGHIFPTPPSIAYRRPKNLRDQLVSSKLKLTTATSTIPGTHPCDKQTCGACPFLDKDPIISGPSGTFKIRRSFNCQRSNVIYVIRCLLCAPQKVFYIGETERQFETRIKEHIADIRHERPTPIGRHFNDPTHTTDHFRAQILWTLQNSNTVARRFTESNFIKQIGTVQPNGLNLKQ